jgi:hypothetical protein
LAADLRAAGAFPSSDVLAGVLHGVNPGLSLDDAYDYAYDLIDANDAGRFDRAKQILGFALRRTGKRGKRGKLLDDPLPDLPTFDEVRLEL